MPLCQLSAMFSPLVIIWGLFVYYVFTVKQGHSQDSWNPQAIAYGGVLNTLESVLSNNTAVWRAAEFAVAFAQKRYPHPIPTDKNGEVQEYKLSRCTQLRLVVTEDDVNPVIVEVTNPSTLDSEYYPIIWGVTSSFVVEWPSEPGSAIHSFTVTEYWDEKFYIFEHTFSHHASIQDSWGSTDATKDKPLLQPEDSGQVDMGAESPSVLSNSLSLGDAKSSTEDKQIGDGQADGDILEVNSPMKNVLHRSHDLGDQKEDGLHKYLAKNRQFPPEDHASVDECDLASGNQCTQSPAPEANDGSDASKGTNNTFSILTFNIWNTNVVEGSAESYSQRMAHIGRLLQSSNADVIGLQEVRFEDGKGESMGPNQVEHLAKYLRGYQFVFLPAQAHTCRLPARAEEGVAIFSKHPILHHDYLLLPRNKADTADSHQRILLHAKILIPQLGPIHVFNTHLSLSHLARQASVVKIWQHISKYQAPVFLLGDFNAEKHNDEVRFLFGAQALKSTSTRGLHDVWQLKYGYGDEGFTFSTLDDELSKRIDFIFMKDHPRIAFQDVTKVDDGSRRTRAASDHTGVLATFLYKTEESL